MTVIVSVPIWPAESLTVTVIGLLPASKTMPDTDQDVVPVAVPDAPVLEFAQVTDVIVAPLPVSLVAVPLRAIYNGELVVRNVEADVGPVIVIDGEDGGGEPETSISLAGPIRCPESVGQAAFR